MEKDIASKFGLENLLEVGQNQKVEEWQITPEAFVQSEDSGHNTGDNASSASDHLKDEHILNIVEHRTSSIPKKPKNPRNLSMRSFITPRSSATPPKDKGATRDKIGTKEKLTKNSPVVRDSKLVRNRGADSNKTTVVSLPKTVDNNGNDTGYQANKRRVVRSQTFDSKTRHTDNKIVTRSSSVRKNRPASSNVFDRLYPNKSPPVRQTRMDKQTSSSRRSSVDTRSIGTSQDSDNRSFSRSRDISPIESGSECYNTSDSSKISPLKIDFNQSPQPKQTNLKSPYLLRKSQNHNSFQIGSPASTNSGEFSQNNSNRDSMRNDTKIISGSKEIKSPQFRRTDKFLNRSIGKTDVLRPKSFELETKDSYKPNFERFKSTRISMRDGNKSKTAVRNSIPLSIPENKKDKLKDNNKSVAQTSSQLVRGKPATSKSKTLSGNLTSGSVKSIKDPKYLKTAQVEEVKNIKSLKDKQVCSEISKSCKVVKTSTGKGTENVTNVLSTKNSRRHQNEEQKVYDDTAMEVDLKDAHKDSGYLGQEEFSAEESLDDANNNYNSEISERQDTVQENETYKYVKQFNDSDDKDTNKTFKDQLSNAIDSVDDSKTSVISKLSAPKQSQSVFVKEVQQFSHAMGTLVAESSAAVDCMDKNSSQESSDTEETDNPVIGTESSTNDPKESNSNIIQEQGFSSSPHVELSQSGESIPPYSLQKNGKVRKSEGQSADKTKVITGASRGIFALKSQFEESQKRPVKPSTDSPSSRTAKISEKWVSKGNVGTNMETTTKKLDNATVLTKLPKQDNLITQNVIPEPIVHDYSSRNNCKQNDNLETTVDRSSDITPLSKFIPVEGSVKCRLDNPPESKDEVIVQSNSSAAQRWLNKANETTSPQKLSGTKTSHLPKSNVSERWMKHTDIKDQGYPSKGTKGAVLTGHLSSKINRFESQITEQKIGSNKGTTNIANTDVGVRDFTSNNQSESIQKKAPPLPTKMLQMKRPYENKNSDDTCFYSVHNDQINNASEDMNLGKTSKTYDGSEKETYLIMDNDHRVNKTTMEQKDIKVLSENMQGDKKDNNKILEIMSQPTEKADKNEKETFPLKHINQTLNESSDKEEHKSEIKEGLSDKTHINQKDNNRMLEAKPLQIDLKKEPLSELDQDSHLDPSSKSQKEPEGNYHVVNSSEKQTIVKNKNEEKTKTQKEDDTELLFKQLIGQTQARAPNSEISEEAKDGLGDLSFNGNINFSSMVKSAILRKTAGALSKNDLTPGRRTNQLTSKYLKKSQSQHEFRSKDLEKAAMEAGIGNPSTVDATKASPKNFRARYFRKSHSIDDSSINDENKSKRFYTSTNSDKVVLSDSDQEISIFKSKTPSESSAEDSDMNPYETEKRIYKTDKTHPTDKKIERFIFKSKVSSLLETINDSEEIALQNKPRLGRRASSDIGRRINMRMGLADPLPTPESDSDTEETSKPAERSTKLVRRRSSSGDVGKRINQRLKNLGKRFQFGEDDGDVDGSGEDDAMAHSFNT